MSNVQDRAAAAPSTVSAELQNEIEQFFYAEAELLDDHRYHDWLLLWTEDCHYWNPSRHTRPLRERRFEVSDINESHFSDDDISLLRGRVRRVTSGMQWSEEPPSRTRRILSNVRIKVEDDGTLSTRLNFYVYRSRLERHQDWFVGERFDRLLRSETGGLGFQIFERKIVFDQTVVLAPSISIFL